MFASEMFKESSFSFALQTDRIWQLFARVRSGLLLEIGPNKAQALHDVLRLDIVSGLGETPSAYGWHVDALLNVEAAPPDWEDFTRPDRGITARVYRVPRRRRRPDLKLLQGGLAGDAA